MIHRRTHYAAQRNESREAEVERQVRLARLRSRRRSPAAVNAAPRRAK